MEKIGNWLVGVENYEVMGVVLGKRWACWDPGSCGLAWYRETKEFTCGSLCWCLESGNCVKPKNAFCILPLTEEAFLGSIFSRELRSIPFNNVKALLDFTFISIAQCFCF
ncbi:hypothetical protein ACSQ67_014486 [Phaseolus vulgaris]